MNTAQLPDIRPYSLGRADKEKLLDKTLTSLSRHHYAHCAPYWKMMDGTGFDPGKDYQIGRAHV